MAQRFIDYDDDPWDPNELQDGDKVWRIVQLGIVVVEGPSAEQSVVFTEDRLYVASLNVGHKFKVYFGDPFVSTPEHVADYGHKLRYELKPLAECLFPNLMNAGWEFITEHG